MYILAFSLGLLRFLCLLVFRLSALLEIHKLDVSETTTPARRRDSKRFRFCLCTHAHVSEREASPSHCVCFLFRNGSVGP